MTTLETTHASRSAFWISDGATTIGPVESDLFLRGVTAGRVPESCWVIGQGWSEWRPVTKVREVVALRRFQSGDIPEAADLSLLDLAADEGELELTALASMCVATRAEFGLLYRMVDGHAVTCAAHGESMIERLGQNLPSHDPVKRFVLSGQSWAGAVGEGPLAEALLRRFGADRQTLRGIAIVPIRRFGEVAAFVELGRTDHAFRSGDNEILATIAGAVTDASTRQMV